MISSCNTQSETVLTVRYLCAQLVSVTVSPLECKEVEIYWSCVLFSNQLGSLNHRKCDERVCIQLKQIINIK